ncbi:hypothetical protein BDR26DRAFT_865067 [Obelidium mucronatum]|nr:hypothetical protein BDR26DRAFT_865067 [Obelidium mucronatum]
MSIWQDALSVQGAWTLSIFAGVELIALSCFLVNQKLSWKELFSSFNLLLYGCVLADIGINLSFSCAVSYSHNRKASDVPHILELLFICMLQCCYIGISWIRGKQILLRTSQLLPFAPILLLLPIVFYLLGPYVPNLELAEPISAIMAACLVLLNETMFLLAFIAYTPISSASLYIGTGFFVAAIFLDKDNPNINVSLLGANVLPDISRSSSCISGSAKSSRGTMNPCRSYIAPLEGDGNISRVSTGVRKLSYDTASSKDRVSSATLCVLASTRFSRSDTTIDKEDRRVSFLSTDTDNGRPIGEMLGDQISVVQPVRKVSVDSDRSREGIGSRNAPP